MHQLRRLALALAVTVVATGGAALMARSAVSSPAAPGAPHAAATDGPATGLAPNTQGTPGQLTTKKTITKTVTKTPTKTVTKTPTKTVTKTPTKTPTRTPTKTTTTTKPATASGGAGVVPGGAGANCANHTASPVTLQIGNVGGREALVDGSGCAVYVNTKDTATATNCDAACEVQFPPVHAPGQAGNGVTQASLGTFARPSGVQQVTFFTKQLYFFSGDTAPGQANGQGVGQIWFLVDRTGQPITQ